MVSQICNIALSVLIAVGFFLKKNPSALLKQSILETHCISGYFS